jgi:hypothetical protein
MLYAISLPSVLSCRGIIVTMSSDVASILQSIPYVDPMADNLVRELKASNWAYFDARKVPKERHASGDGGAVGQTTLTT